MRFRFTKHARGKSARMRASGFKITPSQIKTTVAKPIKSETRLDNTFIATSLLNSRHVLRVVYRVQDDIIIIITFYPGRKKAYAI